MNEDKQTRARIAEHLNNESDQITDADIQNAKTEELVIPEEEEVDPEQREEMELLVEDQTLEETEQDQNENNSLKDNSDPEIDNDSWKVLEP